VKEKKRIFLSLKRRKINILLFFILLFIMVLFIVSMAIYGIAVKNILDIEETYGSSFKFRVLMDTSNPDVWEQKQIETGGKSYSYQAYVGPDIDIEMLKKISEVEGIKEFETGRDSYILLDNYKLTSGANDSAYLNRKEHPEDEELFGKAIMYKKRAKLTMANAVRNSKYHKEFYEGNMKIVEGRHIVPEDVHKVIISNTFAQSNNLKIHDTLKINASSWGIIDEPEGPNSMGEIDTEIIGIFEPTYQQTVSEYTLEYDILNNWIFVDSQTGWELDKIGGVEDQLRSATFWVNTPSQIEKVMEQVKALDWIDWKYYTLEKDASSYSSAIKPLHTIQVIMMVVMGSLTVAGSCVLILVVAYAIKRRVRETGILMSLGITGKEIRRQFLWEHLLIGIAAFFLASLVSFAVTPIIGEQIYGTVHQEKEQKIYTEKEIEAAIARGEQSKVSEMAKNQKTGVEPPKELHTKISVKIVVVVFASMLLIIYFCVNGVIKKTLKLEPIRVLSMIE